LEIERNQDRRTIFFRTQNGTIQNRKALKGRDGGRSSHSPRFGGHVSGEKSIKGRGNRRRKEGLHNSSAHWGTPSDHHKKKRSLRRKAS